jgi:hypothetical protein
MRIAIVRLAGAQSPLPVCCVYSVTYFQAIVTGWEIRENTEFGTAAIGRQQLAFCRQAWLSFRGLVEGHLQ